MGSLKGFIIKFFKGTNQLFVSLRQKSPNAYSYERSGISTSVGTVPSTAKEAYVRERLGEKASLL